MEAQDVAVFDGVGDGVGVQLLLEDVRRGLEAGLLPLDLLIAGVVFKNWRAGKAKQLRVGEELLDCFVVFAKLRAMAFIEDGAPAGRGASGAARGRCGTPALPCALKQGV